MNSLKAPENCQTPSIPDKIFTGLALPLAILAKINLKSD
jgi:hypothetical protein